MGADIVNIGGSRSFNATNSDTIDVSETKRILNRFGFGNLIKNYYKEFLDETGQPDHLKMRDVYETAVYNRLKKAARTLETALPHFEQEEMASIAGEIQMRLVPQGAKSFCSVLTFRHKMLQQYHENFMGTSDMSIHLSMANCIVPDMNTLFTGNVNDYSGFTGDHNVCDIVESVFRIDEDPSRMSSLGKSDAVFLYLCRVMENVQQTAAFSRSEGLDLEVFGPSFFNLISFIQSEIKHPDATSDIEQAIFSGIEELTDNVRQLGIVPEDLKL